MARPKITKDKKTGLQTFVMDGNRFYCVPGIDIPPDGYGSQEFYQASEKLHGILGKTERTEYLLAGPDLRGIGFWVGIEKQ